MPLGQTPYVFQGGQGDLQRIFYSDPNLAMMHAITIPAGYGVIKAGMVMGIITEGNRKNQYVPYCPVADSREFGAGLANVPGLEYLTNEPGTDKVGHVRLEQSYKFVVADHLAAWDDDDVQVDLGAVTAIDRTTYPHLGLITVTNSFGSETVAKGGAIGIQTSTTTPFVAAKGILLGAVDTGEGENAKGGQGVLVIKSAMLYKDNLFNYNANVLSDLSGSEDGKYLVI